MCEGKPCTCLPPRGHRLWNPITLAIHSFERGFGPSGLLFYKAIIPEIHRTFGYSKPSGTLLLIMPSALTEGMEGRLCRHLPKKVMQKRDWRIPKVILKACLEIALWALRKLKFLKNPFHFQCHKNHTSTSLHLKGLLGFSFMIRHWPIKACTK